MGTHTTETAGHIPSAHTPSPVDIDPRVNIDPDFYVPADRGNSFIRAFRILFPKAA